MAQPRPLERQERYLAKPCSGMSEFEPNHVYKILDYEHPSKRITFIGWLTKEEAVKRFGEPNIYFSDSHGLCPKCNRILDLEDVL